MREIDREQLVAELRALRPALERDGVTSMSLFGSRARGDHRPDSDVDLVIEVDQDRRFSLLDLVGVGHQVEDRTGLQANIFMQRSLDDSFLASMRRDQVKLF